MIKLWIDDIRPAPDQSWMVAKTVTSAINALAQFGDQIKEISLDHDISHQISTPTRSVPFACEETFAPVAWFIAYRYTVQELDKIKITLHTANPEGALKMKSIIQTKSLGLVTIKPMGAANRLELEV